VRQRNSQDAEIRLLERKIGSGSYDATDVVKLLTAVKRRQGDPMPRIVEVALAMKDRDWSWNELVRIAKATYDDRFIGRTAGDVANTILNSAADDIATFAVDVLNPPGQLRQVFSTELERLILAHLFGTYWGQLSAEIRRHAEGLGGLALPDLARHVLSRYRTHEEEGIVEDPNLLHELALEAATDATATTHLNREALADMIVERVSHLRDTDELLDEIDEDINR